ncbi:hypothetical protein GCM10029964_084370 [Kibdelosporangium lantanae]
MRDGRSEEGAVRLVLPAVSAAISLLVLTPLLGHGFVLNYDMVFAPEQTLVPDSLGLGSALPRSVPADAVMAWATALVPGDIVQKLVLLLALFLAPLGAGRLVPTDSTATRAVAAVWYGWSAYLAERLFMGHWPYLVAYACLPWITAAGLAVRRGEPKAVARLVLACLPAVITPTGGILAAVLAVVCGPPGGARRDRVEHAVVGSVRPPTGWRTVHSGRCRRVRRAGGELGLPGRQRAGTRRVLEQRSRAGQPGDAGDAVADAGLRGGGPVGVTVAGVAVGCAAGPRPARPGRGRRGDRQPGRGARWG